MRVILALVGCLCALAAFATPALALDDWFYGWTNPPSYYRQAPDGTYPGVGDLSQAVQGTPCGEECSYHAAVRWGLIPPHHRRQFTYYYFYGD